MSQAHEDDDRSFSLTAKGRDPFRAMAEGLADSVTVTTVGEDPRVVYANPAFERLTGYSVG